VLAYQAAVRARISATITRPELAHAGPGLRLGLIDHALAPLRDALAVGQARVRIAEAAPGSS